MDYELIGGNDMKKILGLSGLLFVVLLSSCTKEEAITYEITYHTDGGTIMEPGVFKEGETVDLPSNPEKEGYTFEGWYQDIDLTVPYEPITSIETNSDLYAKYEPLTTYLYLNIGGARYYQFPIAYGEQFELPELTAEGYIYNGWYTESSFDTKISEVTGGLTDQDVFVEFVLKTNEIADEGEIDITTLPYYEYLSEANPVVTITVKDVGVLTLQLFPDVAKNTVDNFISYIEDEQYTLSTFHRIIEGFMIQGGIVSETSCSIEGEFTSNGVENDLSHYRGVLSMARTSIPNSATSQFFIVHEDSFFLDGNYATYGGLTSGFNILDYLASVGTSSSDAPLADVVIESITVELNGYIPTPVVCAE